MNPKDYADDPERYTRAVMLQKLMEHFGHRIVIALYGQRSDPDNAAIECMRCHTVIADWSHPDADSDEPPAVPVKMVRTSRGWHPADSAIAQREQQEHA